MDTIERRALDPRVNRLVEDMQEVKSELAKNTEITTQVRDVLAGFRLVAQISKWVGAIAACVASLLALWHGFTVGR